MDRMNRKLFCPVFDAKVLLECSYLLAVGVTYELHCKYDRS